MRNGKLLDTFGVILQLLITLRLKSYITYYMRLLRKSVYYLLLVTVVTVTWG